MGDIKRQIITFAATYADVSSEYLMFESFKGSDVMLSSMDTVLTRMQESWNQCLAVIKT